MSNLPRVAEGPTTEQLRDRVLARMNGESVRLSPFDQERRKKVLERLGGEAKRP